MALEAVIALIGLELDMVWNAILMIFGQTNAVGLALLFGITGALLVNGYQRFRSHQKAGQYAKTKNSLD